MLPSGSPSMGLSKDLIPFPFKSSGSLWASISERGGIQGMDLVTLAALTMSAKTSLQKKSFLLSVFHKLSHITMTPLAKVTMGRFS